MNDIIKLGATFIAVFGNYFIVTREYSYNAIIINRNIGENTVKNALNNIDSLVWDTLVEYHGFDHQDIEYGYNTYQDKLETIKPLDIRDINKMELLSFTKKFYVWDSFKADYYSSLHFSSNEKILIERKAVNTGVARTHRVLVRGFNSQNIGIRNFKK